MNNSHVPKFCRMLALFVLLFLPPSVQLKGKAAIDPDVHTLLRPINVEKAGTLSSLLTEEQKQSDTRLWVTGNLNGSDIVVLQNMAKAKLTYLDMSGANIVEGGSLYYDQYSTQNDVVGAYMFYKTTSLEEVILPESATTIERGSFGYGSLKKMTIGPNVNEITAGLCAGTTLDNIILNNNPYFVLDGGILYDKDKTTIYKAISSVEGDITLPNSVTTIKNGSFGGCPLRSIVIPSKVTELETGTFGNCANLEEVTFPAGMTYLGYDCFGGCNKLKTIDLSNTKTEEIYMSFYNCQALEEVSLPSTLRNITGSSFTSSVLKKITCHATTPPTLVDGNYRSFPYDYICNNCKVYVPKGCVNSYKSATGWSRFNYIYDDDDEGNNSSYFPYYNGRTWMIGSGQLIRYDFSDINAAMSSSMVKDGDILLVFDSDVNDDVFVTKSVKIVGQTGLNFYADPALGYIRNQKPTIQYLNIEAPNVTIDHFFIYNDINVRDENVWIEHCTVYGNIVSGYNYECDNATIMNCDIKGIVDDSNGSDWTIIDCYVNGQAHLCGGYEYWPLDMPYFLQFGMANSVEEGNPLTIFYNIVNVKSLELVEYFWDTDPGWTKGIELKNDNNNYITNALGDQGLTINTNGLSAGTHTLVVRACSGSGYWAIKYKDITIEAQAPPVVTDPKPVFSFYQFPATGYNNDYKISFIVAAEGGLIDWVEYYWDNDPGEKKGRLIVDGGHDKGQGIERINYEINCQGLTGLHTLYVRAFCGQESTTVYAKDINLSNPYNEPVNANDLAALKLISDNLGLNGYWNFANEGRKESDFPGVTFVDHRVTEIDLSNHALTGELSEQWMPSLSEITYLNLSRNNIYGDLTPLVYHMPKLKTLDVSHNRITNISGALPASVTSLNMRSQMRTFSNNLSGGNESFVSELVSGAISPITTKLGVAVSLQQPTLFYYNADKNDNSLRADIQVVDVNNPSTVYGTYSYNGENKGWKFNPQLSDNISFAPNDLVALVTTGDAQRWSAYPALLEVTLGDSNIDGDVDVLDVQHTLNYILATAQPFNLWAANTYADKLINVQDIVCIVNIILGLPNHARQGGFARCLESGENVVPAQSQCWVYEENNRVVMAPTTDVAAVDIEIDGASTTEVKLLLNHKEFKMIGQNTASGSRYVIFSPTGSTIPTDKVTALLAMSDNASPVAVRCADAQAREIITAIGRTTGINETTTVVGGQTVIETRLAPGIYIVRTIGADGKSKTIKIIKK